MFNINTTKMEHTLNAGKYYLGDPCFALNEHYHYDVWGEYYKYDNGKIDLTYKDEDFMIVHSTHYGDGIYEDTKKRKYSVKSGTLALIPFKCIDNIEIAKKHGKVFEFPEDVLFIYDAGNFVIRSMHFIIKINTVNEDFYESENEDHLLQDGEKVNYYTPDDVSDFEDIYDDESDDEIVNIPEKPTKKLFFKQK